VEREELGRVIEDFLLFWSIDDIRENGPESVMGLVEHEVLVTHLLNIGVNISLSHQYQFLLFEISLPPRNMVIN